MDLLYRQVQEKAAGVYAKAGIQTVIYADLAGILGTRRLDYCRGGLGTSVGYGSFAEQDGRFADRR